MKFNQFNSSPRHLAWHETLELYELVAFQSVGLVKLKETYPKVTDTALRELYIQAMN